MKKGILLLTLFLMVSYWGWGQLVTEPFNYTPDATNGLAKQSASVWHLINTGDSILVTSGSLSYTGFPASTANSVSFGGAGSDNWRAFTSQTSGTVYMSYLLNVSALGTLNATGGYQIAFIDGTTTAYVGRVWIRLSGTSYNLGINAGSTGGNTNWASNTLAVGTTYLVVISYQMVAGASNDIAKLWINPILGGTEPSSNATSTNTGATDNTSIQRIVLRQGSTTDTPGTMVVDEMRVGTTWADVTPASSAGAPTKLAVTSVNAGASPSSNTGFSVVVQSQDGSNVPANVTANTDFSFTLASGTGTLGGTLTGTILAGASSATVTGVTYNTAEAGVSITATRTAGDVLTAGTSGTFTVLPAADHLALVNVPTYGAVATNLNSFTVEARRVDNTVDANYPTNITVAKATGTGNLTGTTAKPSIAGIATFNDLQLDAAGTYTLTATSGSLTAATSGNIEIVNSISYRSKTSGAWNAVGTWEAYIGAVWMNAIEVPTSSNRDVLIQSGHAVNVPLSYNIGAAKNLTIENTGTLYANSSTGSCFVYVYGDILNDGIIGGATDVIGFDIEGTSCLVSGSGSFLASRMSKFTVANATTNFTINQNLTLSYTHATNSALYNGQSGTTIFNIVLGAGKQLTVKNAKIDLTGCTLTLKSDATGTASLLDNGTITGSTAANTTVERYIAQYTGPTDGWHLLASPVGSFTVLGSTFEPVPGTDDLYWYDESQFLWMNWTTTSFNFGTDLGYLCAYGSTATKSFTGTLNTANKTIANVSYTPAQGGGWHIIPNPFPCAITWNSLGMSASGYVSTASGKILNGGVTYTDVTDGQPIPAMNGFFMQVNNAANSITIPASFRAHNAQSWYKSSGDELLMLTVQSSENNTYQENIVRFNSDATEGFDPLYDSHFLPGMTGAPQMFSYLNDNTELSLNTFPELSGNRVVPIGFKKGTSAGYSINVTKMENIGNDVAISLEDTRDNKTQDLRKNPSYQFTSSDGDNTNRFLLHIGATNGVNELSSNKMFNIYSAGNTIYVSNLNGTSVKGQVFVYNLMGQQLLQQDLSGNTMTKVNLNGSTGYYLVKVVTAEGSYSGKVFLR